MARHGESALKIAQWLEQHQGVERVVYPGLPSHPQHALAKKQMAPSYGAGLRPAGPGNFGGMITFYIEGGLDEARRFLESVQLFTLAESLGGVESLIEHPAIMTHASVPPDMRRDLGISDTLIRLSVGIEHVDDLIADLERGFKAAHGGMTTASASPARVRGNAANPPSLSNIRPAHQTSTPAIPPILSL